MRDRRRGTSAKLRRLTVMTGAAIALLVTVGLGLKMDLPWARVLRVTVGNGANLARKTRLLPATAAAAGLPAPGAGPIIAIDPGHGGSEIGAEHDFPNGTSLLEKDLNLQVALKVADLLTKAGYRPVLTRRTDSHVNDPPRSVRGILPIGLADDLQARVDIANNAGARLFLSIHFNGNDDTSLQGSEVYYSEDRPFSADSQRFANLILQNLTSGLARIGYQDPGVVRTDMQALGSGDHFYVLGPQSDTIVRPIAMPGALAEALFLTNDGDATRLKDGHTLDVIALAYATAIHQYFAGNSSPLPQPKPASTSGTRATGQGTIATDDRVGARLRAQPNTTSDVVQELPEGTTIDLLQLTNGQAVASGDARWYRARYNNTEGYVYAEFVQTAGISQIVKTSAQPPLGQGVIANAFGTGALLRAAPDTSSDVISGLPEGDSIDLLKLTTGEAVLPGDAQWYRARYNGDEGYVYGALVQTSGLPAPATTTSTGLGTGTIQTAAQLGALLRAAPNTSSDVVCALPEGDSIDLLQSTRGEAVNPGHVQWYRADYDGSQGYVYADLVRLGQ